MASSEIGKNTIITIKGVSGTDYLEGACVKEISEFSSSANAIDVTCYGPKNITRKIKGIADLGSMTVTIAYNGKATGNGLYTALLKPESCDVEIKMEYGTTPIREIVTFSALVTGVTLSVPKNDVMSQKITLTLDGRVEPSIDTWTP